MRHVLSRFAAILLAAILLFGCLPSAVFASGWDGCPAAEAPEGDGSPENPYLISDAADLKWFADEVNGGTAKSTSELCAKLTADIDLEGVEWQPIGYYNSYSDCLYYGGEFDGNGKTVSGLMIRSDKQYLGLIGYAKGAVVKNLTVEGSVTTSVSSSSYAAGIVAYGSPVTVENCTNCVDVTSEQKGYIAGIVSLTAGGSRIVGCTNTGMISGCGDFVGGIVGSATGSSSSGITEIQNCLNSGRISNTGKPSSYAYSTGGISGGLSGGSTISMCGNTGTVTSTLKRTGGIVGSLAGSAEKCFNSGAVTGTYGAGGIAGDAADKSASLSSCYNTGKVTGKTPVATFKDSNAKGIGGILGGVASNSYQAVLKDCYNTGSVVSETSLADVLSGGIVGDSSGKNYSGTETAGLVSAENCYYCDAAALQGDGRNASSSGMTPKTEAEMKSAGFSSLLGSDYIDDPKGGYPLLGWQDPNAEYPVSFLLNPAAAALTVTGEDGGVILPEEGTQYRLKNGTYHYSVTGEECEPASGSFTVAYGGRNLSVTLQVKTYDFVFVTDPADAELEVQDQTPLADGRTYRLAKAGNPYAYTARAFGYEPETGTVSVSGDGEKDRLHLLLRRQPFYAVEIPVEKEEGGADGEVSVLVSSESYPEADIQPQEDGRFFLPDGEYRYTLSCPGYQSFRGTFTVQGADLTLPQTVLAIQTAWDGETLSEPAKDGEGVYQISSPDELMWFQKNALLTDSARLTADIRINETVLAEDPSGFYLWSPVGTSSSKAYTGDFDGGGHTISGVYIQAKTASNAGLFGYVGAGGSVHDLILSDSSVTGAGKYYGGIAGDLNGTLENCHVTETVTVSGKAYVGGIVGELDRTGSVKACSNAGQVSASGTSASDGYVGGIAGRVYSDSSNALTDSVNTGDVEGISFVGGIAGTIYRGGTLQNVYSSGRVTALNPTVGAAGGLVGHLRTGTIRNAYFSGGVSAARCGGAIGSLEFASGAKTLEQVYYLNLSADSAIGYDNGCPIQTGTAQTCSSEALKIAAEALGDAFFENETEQNGGYPLLYWQIGQKAEDPDAPVPDPEGWNGKTASSAPGQENGVYQISTPAELKWFAKAAKNTPDIRAVLTADIDLNHQPWTPVGGSEAEAFTGVLDGNGKTIRNLYVKSGQPAGLFVYNAGEIRDLTVEGLILCADNAAAVAAVNSGKISGVTAEVTVTGGNRIAGIAARNEKDGRIEMCRNFGAVNGGQFAAGITASNQGTVLDSANSGAVTGTGALIAGIAADNDGGTVNRCANGGQILGKAAVLYSYTGGVVGRNDGVVQDIYNRGNVVSLGSCTGGCVGINASGASASGLYNAGEVCGSYIDTEDGEDFRVGGAVGEVNSGVSNAYTLDMLAIRGGGTRVPAETLSEKAGDLVSMIPVRSSISGEVTFGNLEVESSVQAVYTGNALQPVFVWYYSDGIDEFTLSVSDSYTIPAYMVGYILRVKVIDPTLEGVVCGASEKIDGLTGSVRIDGYPVVGHILQAVYTGSETSPTYRWYRGELEIDGAGDAFYTVQPEDEGKILTVRVTGGKPGYIERKTHAVQTGEQAGIWPEDDTSEPVKIAGEYVISDEAELKWFVNFVNGGYTAANAKLAADIALSETGWYPIGNTRFPYAGLFNGNGRKISGISMASNRDEQGFFGNISGKGQVENLEVCGQISITGTEAISCGGLVGTLDGKVSGCSFSGDISGVQDVGGIVGQAGLNSVIERCVNRGRISGNENIGGIVGSCSYGIVNECVNTGDIGNEVSFRVGGIAGSITNYAVVTACYNTGRVSGRDYLGGIAGEASVCAAPQGCYSVGKVDPGMHAFGVLGSLSGTDYISVVQGSYYLAETPEEATDKTAQGVNSSGMKKAAFVSLLNSQAGSSVFVMDLGGENGGYPLLLWQTGAGGDDAPDNPDEPEILTVTFSLSGDTAHGEHGIHTAYTDWIEPTTCTLPRGATAYDLYKKMMEDYGLSYEANANSYVSSVTGPDGVTLSELANGPRSGWMYTIDDHFPDYMGSVRLTDGCTMRFFYTDDYKDTNWNPYDPAAAETERLIDAIGEVTENSGEAIEMARGAYDLLTDGQKLLVPNLADLEEAERIYAQILAEKPEKDRAAAEETDRLINAIGEVSLSGWDLISAARRSYDALTEDQKALVQNLSVLISAEERFKTLAGEKLAADLAAAENVDRMIDAIASVTVRSGAAVKAARAAYEMLTEDQRSYVTGEKTLSESEALLQKLIAEQTEKREEIIRKTGDVLLSGDTPVYSQIGGGWTVLGLARLGRISDAFCDTYRQSVLKMLEENGSEQLHRAKSTENSRVVIALTSIGIDASDFYGYDLLLPLADADYLERQGINGPIWALIALDTADYAIPQAPEGKRQTTRKDLVQTILSAQKPSGGWALDEEGETVDLTAMALCALSRYRDSDPEVADAVERALLFLSNSQLSDGGFRSFGEVSSEPCAQVVTALASLGIDPDQDERFMKNGRSVLDALTDFYRQDGFVHTQESEAGRMATEQAYYALAAYVRFTEKEPSLYDMRALTLQKIEAEKPPEENPEKPPEGNPENPSEDPVLPQKPSVPPESPAEKPQTPAEQEKPPKNDDSELSSPSVADRNNPENPQTADEDGWIAAAVLLLSLTGVFAVERRRKQS